MAGHWHGVVAQGTAGLGNTDMSAKEQRATRIRDDLYRIEPPLAYDEFGGKKRRTKAVRYMDDGVHGCIVAANERGHIIHWTPLFGGATRDPEQTLRDAGYEIVEEAAT